MLPPAILGGAGPQEVETVPVHSFGFGADHDSITMHAISDKSGGTFSFIESYVMVQDAFASCIGGLLSVVTQGLRLALRSASEGWRLNRSLPEDTRGGTKGTVHVSDLYADEEKEFLINLSVPALPNSDIETERKTSLLDIACSCNDVPSKETVEIERELVEVRRVKTVSPSDMAVDLEVDRQRNQIRAAECIAEAQKIAEMGYLAGARALMAKGRKEIIGSASGQAGDDLSASLAAEMEEMERRMGSADRYCREGRAFALSGMSSHGAQRTATRGESVGGGGCGFGASYSTPSIAGMVGRSRRQRSKRDDEDQATTTTVGN